MNTNLVELRYQNDPDKHKKLLNEIIKELETGIEKIRKSSLIAAENLGTRQYFITEDELENRIKNICGEFRKLKEVIRLRLSPNSQGHAGKLEREQFSKEIAELELEASDLKNKLANDPRNQIEEPEKVKWYEDLLVYSPMILLAGQALYEAAAFRLFAGMMIVAFFIAICFGIAQYYGIRFATEKLMEWTNKNKKIALIISVLLVASATFYGIGLLRNIYMEKQHAGIQNGPVVFMLISMIFFIGAWIGEYIAVPVRETIREKEAKLSQYKSFADAKEKQQQLEAGAKQKQREGNAQLQDRVVLMDTADTFYKRIADQYISVVSEFKSVYLQFRAARDGVVVPDYFKYCEIPPVIDQDDWSALYQYRQNSTNYTNQQEQ